MARVKAQYSDSDGTEQVPVQACNADDAIAYLDGSNNTYSGERCEVGKCPSPIGGTQARLR
jgi:hypothetical protein